VVFRSHGFYYTCSLDLYATGYGRVDNIVCRRVINDKQIDIIIVVGVHRIHVVLDFGFFVALVCWRKLLFTEKRG